MQNQWQSLLDRLWPSRCGPADGQARRMVLLQAFIALAIALASGPEIFLAMEMTTLLELLGASLFLTAFATGAKLTALRVWHAARDIFLPAAQVFIIRSDAPVPAKAGALIYCAVNATWWLCGILVVGVSARSALQVIV